MIKDHEIIIPLENGGSLRCGEGEDHEWGGYLRVCDAQGNEIVFWDRLEWEAEGEGESVVGAAFAMSQKPIDELLKTLKKTRVVDGVWI